MPANRAVVHQQQVRFCRAADGVRIAYAVHGEGPPLVALDSDNHILLSDEPGWQVIVHEVEEFMKPERTAQRPGINVDELLSTRELDVLKLAAEGHDNDAIATTLVLSVRTVERHLQNIYRKLDLTGKSARTAAVARLLSSS